MPPYIVTALVLIVAVLAAAFKNYIPKSDIQSCLIAIAFASGGTDDYAKFGDTTSIGPLWFLFSLFWSQIFYFYIRRYFDGLNKQSLIIGIFAFGWLSSQYVRLPLSIQSGMCAVLFLEIGYLIRKNEILEKVSSLSLYVFFPLILVFLIGWSKGQIAMSIAHYELPFFSIAGSVIASVALIMLLRKFEMGGYYWSEYLIYLVRERVGILLPRKIW